MGWRLEAAVMDWSGRMDSGMKDSGDGLDYIWTARIMKVVMMMIVG